MDDEARKLARRKRRFFRFLSIFGLAIAAFALLVYLGESPQSPEADRELSLVDWATTLTFLAIPAAAGVAAANASFPILFVLRVLFGVVVAILTFAVSLFALISYSLANGGHIHF